MTQEEHKWYVLRVITGKEKQAEHFLNLEVQKKGLEKHLSKILIPSEQAYYLKNGKKYTKEKKFFPGYMLICCEMIGEMPHIIKDVPHVLNFLKEDKQTDKPLPMRMAEINRILGKADEKEILPMAYNVTFKENESVKIIDGPFNTFTGLIEEVNEDRKKLKVSVQIFGRKTPMELSYMQVEKV